MHGMKVSVSLREEDVAFLDAYARSHDVGSRSGAVAEAVRALRATELSAAYEEAFTEWDGSDDAAVWERAAPDGV